MPISSLNKKVILFSPFQKQPENLKVFPDYYIENKGSKPGLRNTLHMLSSLHKCIGTCCIAMWCSKGISLQTEKSY